jgi:peptidoglycan/xylan/chitin deacetylase (PgdA/CDA1 family)
VYTARTMTRPKSSVCFISFLFAALAVVQLGRLTPFAQSRTVRAVALTFDDLPYVAVESADYVHDAERVTTEILRVLRVHNAPAVGFVNEAKVQVQGQMDARVAVLKRWADSGVVLGNHTYSHADLNALTIDQYEDEIIRGEVVTRRLMELRNNPYQLYFRHPFTHTGDTAEKKQVVEGFLAARGYKVAPFTIENSDYIFNVPYVKARRSGDAAMIRRLARAYLDFTFAETAFEETITPQIFGHNIPQTLLIHSNDITADNLDKILTALEERGYRFITLAEAMADDAYRTHDVVTRAGPTWLWRWMKSKGMNLNFRDEPDPPAWVSDLYAKR